MNRIIFIFLFLFLCIGGCSQKQPSTVPPVITPPLIISCQSSGGIAGRTQGFLLTDDPNFLRTNQTVRTKLDVFVIPPSLLPGILNQFQTNGFYEFGIHHDHGGAVRDGLSRSITLKTSSTTYEAAWHDPAEADDHFEKMDALYASLEMLAKSQGTLATNFIRPINLPSPIR